MINSNASAPCDVDMAVELFDETRRRATGHDCPVQASGGTCHERLFPYGFFATTLPFSQT